MKRRQWIRFLLCLVIVADIPIVAHAWWQSVAQQNVGAPAAYTGPGDVVSGAKMWWGLRAYSLATVATRIANICNAADANCADVNSLSNGNFDVATATGAPLNCGGAGGTCTVKTLYDQTTGNNCTAATCDLTQATIGSRPTLTFNCIGSLPCMTFNGIGTRLSSINSATSVSQPFTFSTVANSTATGAQQSVLQYSGGSSAQLGYRNSAANQVFGYAGTVLAATATDGSYHALQAVLNGASSDMNVDGTQTTGAGGASVMSSGFALGATTGATQWLSGTVTEAGAWNAAFSSGQSSSMSTNQHSYWGF